MKVVILAGGYGTRISEESYLKPKPMIEIGEKPILWHIMKQYSYYGFHDFVICCGYKQHVIKEWFADYYLNNSDITFDFTDNNRMIVHNNVSEPWKVTLVDTGLNTMTGGRIKKVQPYLENETFMMTYGDAVSDINIIKLLEFHKEHGKIATMTASGLEPRFGIINIVNESLVESFREKSENDSSLINVGFMVLESEVFRYINNEKSIFEKDVMEQLAKDKELMAFRHNGFWQCMDTQREKVKLEELWESGNAPWNIWRKI